MRLVALLVLCLATLAAPAWAAPKVVPQGTIPGPLGRDSMRIEGTGKLEIRFIPRQEGAPVAEFGDQVPVTFIAAAQKPASGDHPFDLFVALCPEPAEGEAADVSKAYLRCGTISADTKNPVPGTAITATQSAPKKKEAEGVTTYSIAASKRVSVGVLDYPALAKAAGLEDGVNKQLPVTSFSVGLEKDATLRFYAELTFDDGILALDARGPHLALCHPADRRVDSQPESV